MRRFPGALRAVNWGGLLFWSLSIATCFLLFWAIGAMFAVLRGEVRL